MRQLSLYLYASLTLLLTGCATQFNSSELNRIERVAVVGFWGNVTLPNSDDSAPAVIKVTELIRSFDNSDDIESTGNTLNSVFAAMLNEELQWSVVNHNTFKDNNYYSSLYNQYSNNWSNKRIQVNGVMREEFNRLNDKKRQRLIQELDVDAIIYVELDVYVNSLLSLGIVLGTERYQANVSLRTYVANEKKPAWQVHGLKGETVKEKVTTLYGIPLSDNEQESYIMAVTSALESVIKEYKQAMF